METLRVVGARDPSRELFARESVRGILTDGEGRLLMLTSEKYRDCCFPGGGKEAGESDADALVREVLEETGYIVDPDSLRAFGRIDVYLKDRYRENADLCQINRFYFCAGRPGGAARLSESEAKEGVSTIIASVGEAIARNRRILDKGYYWVDRELAVLERLRAGM